MSAPNEAGVIVRSWHCENIGPRQKRRRIRIGIALLLLGDLLAALLIGVQAERYLRLVVAVPFVAGSISLFQVRAATCVLFAARRVKDLDAGEVPVTDSRELTQLARQARVVWWQGVTVGVVLTAIALAIG